MERTTQTIVLENTPFILSAEALAPALRVQAGTEDFEALRVLVAQASALARPKALYAACDVTGRGDDFVALDGNLLPGRLLPQMLGEAPRAFPFVATCGEEAEAWAKSISDPLWAWWADTIMMALLRAATDYLRGHLAASLQVGALSQLNPGALPDWPMEGQRALFDLLGGVPEHIGVRLTDSMLMVPAKSLSGIFFETEREFENCELCARENCPGRRERYTEN